MVVSVKKRWGEAVRIVVDPQDLDCAPWKGDLASVEVDDHVGIAIRHQVARLPQGDNQALPQPPVAIGEPSILVEVIIVVGPHRDPKTRHVFAESLPRFEDSGT